MIDAITTLADVPRNRAPLAMVGSVPHGAGTHRADGTALPRGVGLGACGTSADRVAEGGRIESPAALTTVRAESDI
jgi:hypothetical protein